MMPFTVWGSLLLFVVNWGILGAGIYLGYDCYTQSGPRPTVPVKVELPDASIRSAPADTQQDVNRDSVIQDDVQTVVMEGRTRNDTEWWWKCALAGLCFAITLGGRMPVRLMMSGGKQPATPDLSPASTFQVDRPDGSKLYGEIYGADHLPTLILTHGWSLDSSAWRYTLPALVDEYRVVVWDLAGLGKSTGPKNNDYSLEKLASDLNAVLEYVAPACPVVLIGHSIGGMTEQTFCRLYPNRLGDVVKGIVFVHTTYTNPINTNMFATIVKPLEPLVVMLNGLMIPLSPLMWLSNWQSYWNGSAHIAARLESFTGKQSWEQLDHSARLGAAASPAVVARGNFGMLKFDEQATLRQIEVPVLVISSDNDRLTVRSASQHIESLLPHDTPVTDKGGHLGHWEYREQDNQAILQFARTVLVGTEVVSGKW